MKRRYITFVCVLVTCICACSKEDGTSDAGLPPVFSYEYKGATYNCDDGNCGLTIANDMVVGLSINRPDLFGGQVIFSSSGCAYLDPGNGANTITVHPGCILTNENDTSVDSSVVYLYQSGSISSTSSNCKNKTLTDYWTGATREVRICNIKGSFDLTLVNNKGELIEIMNGKFQGTYQF